MSANQQMLLAGGGPIRGQQAYTTPGTYTWVCPAGVTSVCVVAIGPGANGIQAGGNGGGLGYRNGIAVVPGNSYTVVVGGGGTSTDSYFSITTTVRGRAGANGGGFNGDGGGNGGSGGAAQSYAFDFDGYVYKMGGGGGGAGGYTGAGGAGAMGSGVANGVMPSGLPGSGGGFGGNGGYTSSGGGSPYGSGGGGGGADLYGGITVPNSGAGYTEGRPGRGYGGGGGGGMTINGLFTGGTGGHGAVRIIWGEGRAFPSTRVADE